MAKYDIAAIRDDLAFLDDWEDRYRYIIDLGKTLAPLSEAEHCEDNKVRGCASQVWLVSQQEDGAAGPLLHYRGDSDAHIVKGLVALVLALFSGKTAEDILSTDAPAFFEEIGLKGHLTAQRSNGLASMIERIRSDARAQLR